MRNLRLPLLAASLALMLPAASAPAAEKAIDVDEIPVFDATPRPDDIAVVIGIEKYRDLPASSYSAADAKLFRDYLVALGYPSRNVTVLLDNHATRSDIAMTVERWLPNQVKPDSRVVFYYSGHGSPDPEKKEAYLVPFDGKPAYLEFTAYPIKRLHEKLGELKAKEVMVFLDACFSGAGGRSVLAKGARPLITTIAPIALSAKLAVMSASRDTEISNSSPERGHGLFTYHLLKALRAGKKTMRGIYSYVEPLVADDAKSLNNIDQHPMLAPANLKAGDGRFELARFTKVTLPEEEEKKADAATAAALEVEREKMREQFEQEQKKLADERKRLAEAAAEKDARHEAELAAQKRQLAAEKRRLQREAAAKTRAEKARLARERRALKRREKELRKMRRKRRRRYENFAPPP